MITCRVSNPQAPKNLVCRITCVLPKLQKSSLTVHQATHFAATLQCSFCERKFRDKAGLKRHERIHTGVKRFKCHICDHGFIQSTPYWVHMEKRHNMDRAEVKAKLKEINEMNRRCGIRTELNVLPHSPESGEPTNDAVPDNRCSRKRSASNNGMFSDSEENMGPDESPVKTVKSNAGVKFPILSSIKQSHVNNSKELLSSGVDESSQNIGDIPSVSETLTRLLEPQPSQSVSSVSGTGIQGQITSLPNYENLVSDLNFTTVSNKAGSQPSANRPSTTSGTLTNIRLVPMKLPVSVEQMLDKSDMAPVIMLPATSGLSVEKSSN